MPTINHKNFRALCKIFPAFAETVAAKTTPCEWHEKAERSGFMPLSIKFLYETTWGAGKIGKKFSMMHWYTQNGDLMRDPEMCFEFGLGGGAHLNPFYWRNDYAGIEQWSRFIQDCHYAFHTELYKQHEQFAKQWDKNLRDQGFIEAFERQRNPRA